MLSTVSIDAPWKDNVSTHSKHEDEDVVMRLKKEVEALRDLVDENEAKSIATKKKMVNSRRGADGDDLESSETIVISSSKRKPNSEKPAVSKPPSRGL
jgi:hypothetical protein